MEKNETDFLVWIKIEISFFCLSAVKEISLVLMSAEIFFCQPKTIFQKLVK
jgi:hypothetical protein